MRTEIRIRRNNRADRRARGDGEIGWERMLRRVGECKLRIDGRMPSILQIYGVFPQAQNAFALPRRGMMTVRWDRGKNNVRI